MRKRLAALWLVLVVIISGVLATQMRHGLPLSTDLLALLPQEERDPVLKTANEAVPRALGRHVIVLVGHPERAKARAVAQTMADALAATDLVDAIGSQAMASQFGKSGQPISPIVTASLGRKTGNCLRRATPGRLPGGRLPKPMVLASPTVICCAAILFSFFPRFLMGLPVVASRLAMDNGMLSVTEGGITWVGIIATLRQEPIGLMSNPPWWARWTELSRPAVAEDSRVRDLLEPEASSSRKPAPARRCRRPRTCRPCRSFGTVLLILVVFRRVGPLVQNTLAILVGTIVGVAATILIFGEIHAIALLFGTSLIGTSVDYGLFYSATVLDPKARRLRSACDEFYRRSRSALPPPSSAMRSWASRPFRA